MTPPSGVAATGLPRTWTSTATNCKERWKPLGKPVGSRPGSKGRLVQDLAEKRPSTGEGCRTVLVVCSTFRDHRELPRLARPGLNYLFHDYASTSLEELICGKGDGLGRRRRSDRRNRAHPRRDRGSRHRRDRQHRRLPRRRTRRRARRRAWPSWPRPESEPHLPEQISVATGAKPHRSRCGSSLLADRRCRARPAPRWARLPRLRQADEVLLLDRGATDRDMPPSFAEVKRKWAELDAFFMPLDRLLRRHVDAGDRHHASHRRRPAQGRAGHGRRLCLRRRRPHSRRGRFDLLPRTRSPSRASTILPRCRKPCRSAWPTSPGG